MFPGSSPSSVYVHQWEVTALNYTCKDKNNKSDQSGAM